MSLLKSLTDEIRRGPLAVSLNVLMAVTGGFSLWIAWQQPVSPIPATQAHELASNSQVSYAVWTLVALFFSVTGATGGLLRLLGKHSAWTAVLLSVVAAILSIFLTTWAAQRFGFNVVEGKQAVAFNNITFWGTLIIFLALAGKEVVIELARPSPSSVGASEQDRTPDGLATIGGIVLVISIWGAFVGAGQKAAIEAFL